MYTNLQLFYWDHEDTMEVTESENPFPFPKLSPELYRRQNKKSNKNASREKTRQCNPGPFGIDGSSDMLTEVGLMALYSLTTNDGYRQINFL